VPAGFSDTPVKGSAEDIYWANPRTVHDYKKKSDLHSITISTMALTELEFVRLGDGLINFSIRSNKNPISRSLDSLEYAYSKLPRIEPVQRITQLFDALQLRQISLSDARILGSVLNGGYGGVTPIMQVRVYKLVVFVEDVINDLDRTVMAPVDWGVSSFRNKPTHIKNLGYAADGLGFLRWNLATALKYISQKITRFSATAVMFVEKLEDKRIRRKLKKEHGHYIIYAKMPLEVYEKNRTVLTNNPGPFFAGTLTEWCEKISSSPNLLPEDVRKSASEFPICQENPNPSARSVIIASEYQAWDKMPRELKKYVISPDEFSELIKARQSAPAEPVLTVNTVQSDL
jgi:hypothetical protein